MISNKGIKYKTSSFKTTRMGRPSKYGGDPLGPQKAYLKTPSGKAAYKKYQTSEKGKKKKREWAHRERLKQLSSKPQKFIDKYGDIDRALNLLDDREEEVIVKIYGLDGNLPIKQKEIAELWGTKPQWISQIKLSAIAKLEKVTKSKPEAIAPQQEGNPPQSKRESEGRKLPRRLLKERSSSQPLGDGGFND